MTSTENRGSKIHVLVINNEEKGENVEERCEIKCNSSKKSVDQEEEENENKMGRKKEEIITHKIYYPQVKIVKVSCGKTIIGFLSSVGKIYCWHLNTLNDYDRNVPYLLTNNLIKNKTIHDVSSGYHHIAFLSKEGELFTYGDNSYGQLGNNTVMKGGELPLSVSASASVSASVSASAPASAPAPASPETMPANTGSGSTVSSKRYKVNKVDVDNNIVKGVYCSENYTMYLTIDGLLYGFGFINQHLLKSKMNKNICRKILTRPHFVHTNNMNFKKIAIGTNFMLGISFNNFIYSWGDNTNGTLGYDNTVECYEPRKIESLKNVISVSAGKISLCKTAEGHIYIWGGNYGKNPNLIKNKFDDMYINNNFIIGLCTKKNIWVKNIYRQAQGFYVNNLQIDLLCSYDNLIIGVENHEGEVTKGKPTMIASKKAGESDEANSVNDSSSNGGKGKSGITLEENAKIDTINTSLDIVNSELHFPVCGKFDTSMDEKKDAINSSLLSKSKDILKVNESSCGNEEVFQHFPEKGTPNDELGDIYQSCYSNKYKKNYLKQEEETYHYHGYNKSGSDHPKWGNIQFQTEDQHREAAMRSSSCEDSFTAFTVDHDPDANRGKKSDTMSVFTNVNGNDIYSESDECGGNDVGKGQNSRINFSLEDVGEKGISKNNVEHKGKKDTQGDGGDITTETGQCSTKLSCMSIDFHAMGKNSKKGNGEEATEEESAWKGEEYTGGSCYDGGSEEDLYEGLHEGRHEGYDEEEDFFSTNFYGERESDDLDRKNIIIIQKKGNEKNQLYLKSSLKKFPSSEGSKKSVSFSDYVYDLARNNYELMNVNSSDEMSISEGEEVSGSRTPQGGAEDNAEMICHNGDAYNHDCNCDEEGGEEKTGDGKGCVYDLGLSKVSERHGKVEKNNPFLHIHRSDTNLGNDICSWEGKKQTSGFMSISRVDNLIEGDANKLITDDNKDQTFAENDVYEKNTDIGGKKSVGYTSNATKDFRTIEADKFISYEECLQGGQSKLGYITGSEGSKPKIDERWGKKIEFNCKKTDDCNDKIFNMGQKNGHSAGYTSVAKKEMEILSNDPKHSGESSLQFVKERTIEMAEDFSKEDDLDRGKAQYNGNTFGKRTIGTNAIRGNELEGNIREEKNVGVDKNEWHSTKNEGPVAIGDWGKTLVDDKDSQVSAFQDEELEGELFEETSPVHYKQYNDHLRRRRGGRFPRKGGKCTLREGRKARDNSPNCSVRSIDDMRKSKKCKLKEKIRGNICKFMKGKMRKGIRRIMLPRFEQKETSKMIQRNEMKKGSIYVIYENGKTKSDSEEENTINLSLDQKINANNFNTDDHNYRSKNSEISSGVETSLHGKMYIGRDKSSNKRMDKTSLSVKQKGEEISMSHCNKKKKFPEKTKYMTDKGHVNDNCLKRNLSDGSVTRAKIEKRERGTSLVGHTDKMVTSGGCGQSGKRCESSRTKGEKESQQDRKLFIPYLGVNTMKRQSSLSKNYVHGSRKLKNEEKEGSASSHMKRNSIASDLNNEVSNNKDDSSYQKLVRFSKGGGSFSDTDTTGKCYRLASGTCPSRVSSNVVISSSCENAENLGPQLGITLSEGRRNHLGKQQFRVNSHPIDDANNERKGGFPLQFSSTIITNECKNDPPPKFKVKSSSGKKGTIRSDANTAKKAVSKICKKVAKGLNTYSVIAYEKKDDKRDEKKGGNNFRGIYSEDVTEKKCNEDEEDDNHICNKLVKKKKKKLLRENESTGLKPLGGRDSTTVKVEEKAVTGDEMKGGGRCLNIVKQHVSDSHEGKVETRIVRRTRKTGETIKRELTPGFRNSKKGKIKVSEALCIYEESKSSEVEVANMKKGIDKKKVNKTSLDMLAMTKNEGYANSAKGKTARNVSRVGNLGSLNNVGNMISARVEGYSHGDAEEEGKKEKKRNRGSEDYGNGGERKGALLRKLERKIDQMKRDMLEGNRREEEGAEKRCANLGGNVKKEKLLQTSVVCKEEDNDREEEYKSFLLNMKEKLEMSFCKKKKNKNKKFTKYIRRVFKNVKFILKKYDSMKKEKEEMKREREEMKREREEMKREREKIKKEKEYLNFILENTVIKTNEMLRLNKNSFENYINKIQKENLFLKNELDEESHQHHYDLQQLVNKIMNMEKSKVSIINKNKEFMKNIDILTIQCNNYKKKENELYNIINIYKSNLEKEKKKKKYIFNKIENSLKIWESNYKDMKDLFNLEKCKNNELVHDNELLKNDIVKLKEELHQKNSNIKKLTDKINHLNTKLSSSIGHYMDYIPHKSFSHCNKKPLHGQHTDKFETIETYYKNNMHIMQKEMVEKKKQVLNLEKEKKKNYKKYADNISTNLAILKNKFKKNLKNCENTDTYFESLFESIMNAALKIASAEDVERQRGNGKLRCLFPETSDVLATNGEKVGQTFRAKVGRAMVGTDSANEAANSANEAANSASDAADSASDAANSASEIGSRGDESSIDHEDIYANSEDGKGINEDSENNLTVENLNNFDKYNEFVKNGKLRKTVVTQMEEILSSIEKIKGSDSYDEQAEEWKEGDDNECEDQSNHVQKKLTTDGEQANDRGYRSDGEDGKYPYETDSCQRKDITSETFKKKKKKEKKNSCKNFSDLPNRKTDEEQHNKKKAFIHADDLDGGEDTDNMRKGKTTAIGERKKGDAVKRNTVSGEVVKNVEKDDVEQGDVEQGDVEQGDVEQDDVEQGDVEQDVVDRGDTITNGVEKIKNGSSISADGMEYSKTKIRDLTKKNAVINGLKKHSKGNGKVVHTSATNSALCKAQNGANDDAREDGISTGGSKKNTQLREIENSEFLLLHQGKISQNTEEEPTAKVMHNHVITEKRKKKSRGLINTKQATTNVLKADTDETSNSCTRTKKSFDALLDNIFNAPIDHSSINESMLSIQNLIENNIKNIFSTQDC
ncbi:hypothetical protein, conserved [Plasmodium ovale wallikeri]|uniref:Regulator of chromosome condensation n=1 Tax=Plasmodium ovale wallikeri TaxID=864142 RepID=A0A1A8YPS5_PLAOA|nr:hypothetical protein, conserved [Plasmodium ovale wallikeri]SBT33941.1 hypothetical protein, conserved [Plasmodium ovale wallikeri]